MPEQSTSSVAFFKPDIDAFLPVINAGGKPIRYGKWKNVILFYADDPKIGERLSATGALLVINAGSAKGCSEDVLRSGAGASNTRMNEALR